MAAISKPLLIHFAPLIIVGDNCLVGNKAKYTHCCRILITTMSEADLHDVSHIVEGFQVAPEGYPSAASVKKKKKKGPKKKLSQANTHVVSSETSASSTHGDVAQTGNATKSGESKKSSAANQHPPSLRLARNKHWKFVSSFHVCK